MILYYRYHLRRINSILSAVKMSLILSILIDLSVSWYQYSSILFMMVENVFCAN